MKSKSASSMKNILLQITYALYVYALIKIILFKFGSIEPGFLWDQLQHAGDSLARQLQWGNFTPLVTISDELRAKSAHSMVNLLGNIALFIPLGVFARLLSPGRRLSLPGMLLRGLGLSLLLECAQGVFAIGTFDVDDLLLNTLGALLGYGLCRLLMGGKKPGAERSSEFQAKTAG
ncbi:VanZ family protein [Paenibacillus sp. NFR01]|uniref:VanZ family protein n=1 Tax=Paenibacillus sp. NFR01 TaxID=1566279 RepID=UPI0008B9021B|nr:VanZ family protein [Paenibacillus sp. NFR01]SET91139.1 Glycopeptide antibiotics resistance protein [Paenibacillus sp. NFR01]